MFQKEDTMRILFSDGKMFDLDSIHNSQNDRIWTVKREEANRRGGKEQQRKFPQKVMVWLAVCSEGVVPLVLFEKGTLDHHRYIKKVLSVALRYGNSKFGNNWTSNKTTEHHILTKRRKNGVSNIFHHFLTRIHDQRIVPI